MKSATMVWHHQTATESETSLGQRLSAVLALSQWVCVPLLAFGAGLLTLTLGSSIAALHDVLHLLELAACVLGIVAPIAVMVRARKWHRTKRFPEAVLANSVLILVTVAMLVNIVNDGRLF